MKTDVARCKISTHHRTLRNAIGRRILSRQLESLESRVMLAGDDTLGAVAEVAPAAVSAPWHSAQNLTVSDLVVRSRDSYLPGVPVLLQFELVGTDGQPLKDLWDASVSISSTTPGVSFTRAGFFGAGDPITSVPLYNGYGSVLVNVVGTNGDFVLNTTYGDLSSTRTLTSLAGVPQTNVTGTLPGLATNWSGVVHVTGDVTVPAGHTLNIQPGTLVLVDGTAALFSTTGRDLIVNGVVNSLGTQADPVTFIATVSNAPWGQILHNSGTSNYQHTEMIRGGHSPTHGHTGTGPTFRAANSTINFNNVIISDAAGKAMVADDSQLNFDHFNMARNVMGPEIDDTGLTWTNSYVQDFMGYYQENGEEPDDNDGIYIHTQNAGQTITIDNVVFANGDDDGIDTLGAIAHFEDLIIRGYDNPLDDSKGISITNNTVTIDRVLVVDCAVGIAAKAFNTNPVNVSINNATIVTTRVGILAERAGGGHASAILNFDVQNTIVSSPDSVNHEYNQNNRMVVNYSLLTEVWPGVGNLVGDPLFVNQAAGDYHLQYGSPAIDSGNPASPADPDGTRADMGYYAYQHGQVEDRHIFYNRSAYDGLDPAASAADDNAIAPDKHALLPGGTSSFANYTNYLYGINGIMIDVADLAGTPTAGDFTFRTGNDSTPDDWATLPTSPSISVREGAGVNGSDRITLIWPDFAIFGTWLQVQVLPSANTGLAAADVFYFGNAIGEAGHSAISYQVTAIDEIYARNNPRSNVNPAPIDFPWDYNRDRRVTATDQIISRNNRTTILTMLKPISPPANLAANGLEEGVMLPTATAVESASPVAVKNASTPSAAASALRQSLSPQQLDAFYGEYGSNSAGDSLSTNSRRLGKSVKIDAV